MKIPSPNPRGAGSGLQLSPFGLPLRPGVSQGEPSRFDGLMGLFDDSLPDGWGRRLIDRRARKAGLSMVGSRTMGALVYEPDQTLEQPTVVKLEQFAGEVASVLADGEEADFDRLFAIGDSPHGARPKALVQQDAKGALHAGMTSALPGCTAWLVKFRSHRETTWTAEYSSTPTS